MDDKEPVAVVEEADNESVIAFRIKVFMANITYGMICRKYWPFYNRGLAYVIEGIEMWFAKRVSKNFVNCCGMRLVDWANEHEYPHDQLMNILSDYDTDMIGTGDV